MRAFPEGRAYLLDDFIVRECAAILHISTVLSFGHVFHEAAWGKTPLWL